MAGRFTSSRNPNKPANAAACKEIVEDVLAPHKHCEASGKKHCSFNGAWDGSQFRGETPSSYLGRVSQAGLVDPDQPSGMTTPGKSSLQQNERA